MKKSIFFLLIFVCLLLPCAFGIQATFFHFVIKPDLVNTQKQLTVRLAALKRKTKDFDNLRFEKEFLESQTVFLDEFIKNKIPWSNHLQELAAFNEPYPIWWSQLHIGIQPFNAPPKTRKKRRSRRTRRFKRKAHFLQPFIEINGLAWGNDTNTLVNYHEDMFRTKWATAYFSERKAEELTSQIVKSNKINKTVTPHQNFSLDLFLTPQLDVLKTTSFGISSNWYSGSSSSSSSSASWFEPGSKIKEENKELETSILIEEKRQKEMDRFNSQILFLTRKFHSYSTLFPRNHKGLDELRVFIKESANKAEIPALDFKPKFIPLIKHRNEKSPFFGIDIPLRFEMTYENLGQFLSDIESSSRYLTIQKMTVKANNSHLLSGHRKKEPLNNKTLQVQMLLRAYYIMDGSTFGSAPISGVSAKASSLKEWKPYFSRDPFSAPREKKEKIVVKAIDTNEDNVCRYYDLDSRCTTLKNKISDFCQKHFLLTDEISRQENVLKKAKELFSKKIQTAIKEENFEAVEKYSAELNEILRFPIRIEWIKIEMEDLKQRFTKAKKKLGHQINKSRLKNVLILKKEVLKNFLEGKYKESLHKYYKAVKIVEEIKSVDGTLTPELETLLSELKAIMKKAQIHAKFSDSSLKIEAILYNHQFPEKSIVLLEGNMKKLKDSVDSINARIIEIREDSILFSYHGENVSKKLHNQ